jgi:hypothetical protein
MVLGLPRFLRCLCDASVPRVLLRPTAARMLCPAALNQTLGRGVRNTDPHCTGGGGVEQDEAGQHRCSCTGS